MDFISFFTPRNIIDLALASGLVAQLLPPVNKFIGRVVTNRYGRIGMDVAEAMSDGKLTELEVRNIIATVYAAKEARANDTQ